MKERDKYLTEAMDECWHELPDITHQSSMTKICKNCGTPAPRGWLPFKNNDFSTWDGFGKLWEWCKEQEWWKDGTDGFFWFNEVFIFDLTEDNYSMNPEYINPDRFANAVYEFLKSMEK